MIFDEKHLHFIMDYDRDGLNDWKKKKQESEEICTYKYHAACELALVNH